jgi:citrate lyase alpha subunit
VVLKSAGVVVAPVRDDMQEHVAEEAAHAESVHELEERATSVSKWE